MNRKIEDKLSYENYDSLLSHFVDIYGALYYPRKQWLTLKEKEFFLILVKLNIEGIELSSKTAVNRLREVFTTLDKDRSVWIYRGFLKKKKWLIQSPKGLLIPPVFNYFLKSVNLKIQLKNETDR